MRIHRSELEYPQAAAVITIAALLEQDWTGRRRLDRDRNPGEQRCQNDKRGASTDDIHEALEV
jgi:hypothetical protein